jgi:hypothetical protein
MRFVAIDQLDNLVFITWRLLSNTGHVIIVRVGFSRRGSIIGRLVFLGNSIH